MEATNKQTQNSYKYFTPSIEDIHVGYECEVKDPIGFHEELWQKQILDKNILGYFQGNWEHVVRVPYLTKEQIEKEGWKEVPPITGKGTGEAWFRKNRDYILYNYTAHKLLVTGEVHPDDLVYDGECKDINTFRKICKLLNI